jgi:hypothetical protein
MKVWRYIFLSLILFSFVLTGLNLKRYYCFLAQDKRVICNALLLEGWLPDYAIENAIQEFHTGSYRHIITTGFPYKIGFLMGSQGKLEFDIPPQNVFPQPDNNITITLRARGTKAYNEYAHFTLYADSVYLGENYTRGKFRDFSFTCSGFSPDMIRIEFDNDTYSRFRDRNLIVYSLKVNGIEYNINSDRAIYYHRKSGKYHPHAWLNQSSAHELAQKLVRRGIADSLIIPVSSIRKYKSKTYTNGLDVIHWIEGHPQLEIQAINIFTLGSHARRSLLSYQKAFDKQPVELGVISCHDIYINQTNWWKSWKGVKEILYETTGLLFVSLFL